MAKEDPRDLFSAWNLKLLQAFFSPASRDDDVFLHTDPQTLDEIGQDLGGDSGFIAAIKTGPRWTAPSESFVERCVRTMKCRTARTGCDDYIDPGAIDSTYAMQAAPAYLPFLAVVVRSVAIAHRDVYTHLSESVGARGRLSSPDMARIDALWKDLQLWTRQTKGAFGRFKYRQLGGLRWIGIPRSQCILKETDVERLPIAFRRAGISRGTEFSELAKVRVIHEVSLDNGTFTSPFRDACGDEALGVPIREMLGAIFENWDGSSPEGRGGSGAQGGYAPERDEAPPLQACLVVERNSPIRVGLRWRIAPRRGGEALVVRGPDGEWLGTSCESEWVTLEPSRPEIVEQAWEVAANVFSGEASFKLIVSESESAEQEDCCICLPMRKLWILSPEVDYLTGRYELRESPLPGHGPAYLLVPPKCVGAFRTYLEREQPACTLEEFEGIPAGWLLASIRDCSSLSESQRILPDGASGAHPKPKIIRLRGGRSIIRGAQRHFVHYDLPLVELDAPKGTTLGVMGDLDLVETCYEPHPGHAAAPIVGLRSRFELRSTNGASGSNRIIAMRGGKIVDQATVRVIGAEPGMPAVNSIKMCISPAGDPMESDDGLRGALLQNTWTVAEGGQKAYSLPSVRRVGIAGEPIPLEACELLLLDTVARLGSVAWGPFRDQASRLQAAAGQMVQPAIPLLALRCRGLVEVATTSRGHLARVHACPPTIYGTNLTLGGRLVLGIAGSLTLAQWRELAEEDVAWEVVGHDADPMSWRLVENEPGWASERALEMGFEFRLGPAGQVASWTASLADMRDLLLRDSSSDIGRAREEARRFNPANGKFTAKPNNLPCELWRVADLSTGVDNVHVLVHDDRYSFVRDSRWGAWVSLDATAAYFSQLLPDRRDLHPLPLPYACRDGTVWLPARLNLPVVLERALVLCSGLGPEHHDLAPRDEDTHGADALELLARDTGCAVAKVHRMFYGMAAGRWLAYRFVPRDVAELVAQKLGARLDAY